MRAVAAFVMPWLAFSLGVGTLLTSMILFAGTISLAPLAAVELWVAMCWVALFLNGVFQVGLTGAWPIVRRLAPSVRGHFATYSLAGLLGGNLAWTLWHRLVFAHEWISHLQYGKLLIGWLGIVENGVLVVVAGGTLVAGLAWRVGRRGTAAAAAAAVVVLGSASLYWNSVFERRFRLYPPERIHQAAGGAEAPTATRTGPQPVIIVGLDGLSWPTLIPLLDADRLPTLAGLIRRGAVGFLGNQDNSLSHVIWTTIFTGRSEAAHGILFFKKMLLPRTGAAVRELLLVRPTIYTFYGLSRLLHAVPNPGLWEMTFVGSADRREPAVWDVASHYGKRVVVANPMVNLPVRPVNGAAMDLTRVSSPDLPSVHPPRLAERWSPPTENAGWGTTDESMATLARIMHEEVDFTVELIREFSPDLAVYYTHFPDTVAHANWDFWRNGELFPTNAPESLSNEEWERLVVKSENSRVFGAYRETDRAVKRLVDAFPDATYLVVSDHGWTYSGYRHYGSQEGILIVSGPGARPGAVVRGATILDVTPTALALIGAPLSRKLEGAVIDGAFVAPPDPTWVESYDGIVQDDGGAPTRIELEALEVERLRAIGYMD